MRNFLNSLTVALITFAFGITITFVRRTTLHKSIEPIATTNHLLFETQPKNPLSLPIHSQATAGGDLSIVVNTAQPNPNPPSTSVRFIKLSKNLPTMLNLDLVEDIHHSEVRILFHDSSKRYRILQRYRTSLTINAEGPHLDLLDWRHFDSPWVALNSPLPKRFTTLPTHQMESSRFPRATKSEILKAVRKRVGTDWPYLLELAAACSGPNEGACYVSISSIYLRVQEQVQRGWRDVGVVEFSVPMGC